MGTSGVRDGLWDNFKFSQNLNSAESILVQSALRSVGVTSECEGEQIRASSHARRCALIQDFHVFTFSPTATGSQQQIGGHMSVSSPLQLHEGATSTSTTTSLCDERRD